MLDTLKNFAVGWKTHGVNVAGIATAVIGYATGQLTLAQAICAGLVALGLTTLRSGLARYHDQVSQALSFAVELNNQLAKSEGKPDAPSA